MAIVTPYIQKDPFGGPAGSTQMAMQQLVSGIIQGAQQRRKQEQNRRASQMLQTYMTNVNQGGGAQPGQNFSTNSMVSPQGPADFVQSLLANPMLDMRTKAAMTNLLGNVSGMQYNQARTNALMNPSPETPKPSWNTVWASNDGENWVPVTYLKQNERKALQQAKESGYTKFRDKPPTEKGENTIQVPGYGKISEKYAWHYMNKNENPSFTYGKGANGNFVALPKNGKGKPIDTKVPFYQENAEPTVDVQGIGQITRKDAESRFRGISSALKKNASADMLTAIEAIKNKKDLTLGQQDSLLKQITALQSDKDPRTADAANKALALFDALYGTTGKQKEKPKPQTQENWRDYQY